MHRVTFNIATLMHQILNKRCPSYLADLVTFNTTYLLRLATDSDLRLPDPPPYDAHELSLESVHFLFSVLLCGIVFLQHFVILTVIQFSGVHSSHIYLAVLFPHNYLLSHSFTDTVMHSRPYFVDWHKNIVLYCIVLYCIVHRARGHVPPPHFYKWLDT